MHARPLIASVHRWCFATRRRGVVSVLAMMFLVMFASLGIALAVVSQGNLRTAETHLTASTAVAAAETGMELAKSRLTAAVSRFQIDRGQVTSDLGAKLWSGSWSSPGDGVVSVRPPQGYLDTFAPTGIVHVLMNIHSADQNTVTHADGVNQPGLYSPPSTSVRADEASSNWVRTPTLSVSVAAAGAPTMPPSFRIWYIPLNDGTRVRVRVTGYGSVSASGSSYVAPSAAPAEGSAEGGTPAAPTVAFRPLERTIEQDFQIVKRPKYAVTGGNRIMLGRGAVITGDIGSTYTQFTDQLGNALANADPVVLQSDFYGLDTALDAKLNDFFAGVKQYDVDMDGRLRPAHATESRGLPSNTKDYNADGVPDRAFDDVTGDGYVDDFDIFLKHFDRDNDGRVTLSTRLTNGTPAAGRSAEFTSDDDLALLIDARNPDRNRNAIFGYVDANANNKWDAGETILDSITLPDGTGVLLDVQGGWRDGVIDRKDQYAKVNGRIQYRAPWSTYQSSLSGRSLGISDILQGSISPQQTGQAPVEFGVSADDLPEVNSSTFTSEGSTGTRARESLLGLRPASTKSFWQQVGEQIGVAPTSGQTWQQACMAYTETRTDRTRARFFRSTMPNAQVVTLTGQNIWERSPFQGMTTNDFYFRNRFENMVFSNVEIPQGVNGLFVNCTLVGVTWIRTQRDNSWPQWPLYGAHRWDAATSAPILDTKAIDKSDFARWTTGNVLDGPANYTDFYDPPKDSAGAFITGTARDTKARSANHRFHSCTIAGSMVSDTPVRFEHVRNKLQFTGVTTFALTNPKAPTNSSLNPDPTTLSELRKSSLMVPNFSVDLGQFNAVSDLSGTESTPSTDAQNIALSGTIVAGVIDARGNVSIDGSVLLTYSPKPGEGALNSYGQSVGNPANFNSSFGYFGSADGDTEGGGANWKRESMVIENNVRIIGWDLDGDGIADIVPPASPTAAQRAQAGFRAIPFNGYGRVNIRWNPDIPMPDGILLPLAVRVVPLSYREGAR
jgi:hypothetical protein